MCGIDEETHRERQQVGAGQIAKRAEANNEANNKANNEANDKANNGRVKDKT